MLGIYVGWALLYTWVAALGSRLWPPSGPRLEGTDEMVRYYFSQCSPEPLPVGLLSWTEAKAEPALFLRGFLTVKAVEAVENYS